MKDPKTITLNYAVESYLNHLEKKDTTISVYRRSLDIALLYFGTEKDIIGITLPMVGKFFNNSQVNKHPSGRPKAKPTIIQTKRVFRQCMEFARNEGWIKFSPIPKSEMQHSRSKKQVSSQSENANETPDTGISDKVQEPDNEANANS